MTDTNTPASGAVADILAYHQRDEVGMTLTDNEVRDVAATLRALSAERDALDLRDTEMQIHLLVACTERDEWKSLYTACFADAASNSIRLAEGEHRAKAAEARVNVLEAALQRIWDHCQNSGIEHATVGMRVIERVEDEVAGMKGPKP